MNTMKEKVLMGMFSLSYLFSRETADFKKVKRETRDTKVFRRSINLEISLGAVA
jgi:hypothetical protein